MSAETAAPESGIEEAREAEERDERYELDEDTVKRLAEGCLAPHLPQLQESQAQLHSLREHHRILIETVQGENAKFGDCQALTDVTDMMDKARQYHDKLLHIKKEMHALHDKSARLKRRALRLQQEKQKEELQREQQRERELERERQLAAKPAKVVPTKREKVT